MHTSPESILESGKKEVQFLKGIRVHLAKHFPDLDKCGIPMEGDPISPCCKGPLSKWPQRKTLCPACKQPMWPRKRPSDEIRVLCDAKSLARIEEAWDIAQRMKKLSQEYGDLFWNTKEAMELKRSLSTLESFNDVEWSMLNKLSQQYVAEKQWGLYRNLRFRQAEILIMEQRHEEALRFLFAVAIFDMNEREYARREWLRHDPVSTQEEIEHQLAAAYPDEVAPGVLSEINDEIRLLQLSMDKTQELFIESTRTEATAHHMQIRGVQAWKQLRSKLDLSNRD